MKVIFLSPVPAPYQIAFAEAMQEYADIEFWFMTSIKDSTRPAYWERPLPLYCKILPTYFRKQLLFFCPSLPKLLTDFNPDIIILHGKWNNFSWLIAYWWSLKHKKKMIMGPLEKPTKQSWLKEVLRKVLYQKIDTYLCVGYASLDYYSTIKEKEKVYLFSYAADLEREFLHELRTPTNEITFLHSGSINHRFRVTEIVKTFNKVAELYSNIRLVLSGTGPLVDECKSIIENSPLLSSRVSWIVTESWEEVQDLYNHADILISYPTYAGWGLTIPEAMASGMGIIAGICVESARELLINGYNGYLVRDNIELERAMTSYIIEPEKIQDHGRINKKIAVKEGVLEKAKDLYQILDRTQTKIN
jgi:glycosyltransferase involved in cell wall biosynthesis